MSTSNLRSWAVGVDDGSTESSLEVGLASKGRLGCP